MSVTDANSEKLVKNGMVQELLDLLDRSKTNEVLKYVTIIGNENLKTIPDDFIFILFRK